MVRHSALLWVILWLSKILVDQVGLLRRIGLLSYVIPSRQPFELIQQRRAAVDGAGEVVGGGFL